jgi:hypothetical protein
MCSGEEAVPAPLMTPVVTLSKNIDPFVEDISLIYSMK